jgi:DNA-3-methyladenine glycosylase
LLATDTLAAARALIGVRIGRGSGPTARVGRIVEVEAYIGQEDLACHARFGYTKRNAVMFGPPGAAYVYLVYGMYHCLNVVTEAAGRPAAVLIRAVEPVLGAPEMRAVRLRAALERSRRTEAGAAARTRRRIETLPEASLASGPGLVCAAFSIGRQDDGTDLCDERSDLRLESSVADEELAVETGPRIGIDYAPEPWRGRPWRFYVPGNRAVSGTAKK